MNNKVYQTYTSLKKVKEATIEELADRWWFLYEKSQQLSNYEWHYYNTAQGDIFDSRDIEDFKKAIRKNNKEMAFIETHRPEVIDYMFKKK